MGSRTGRPWRRVKARVIRRDHGICHICGGPGADSADHIIPVSLGGPIYDMDNLRTVHHNVQPRCNMVRGTRTIDSARRRLARPEPTRADWDW